MFATGTWAFIMVSTKPTTIEIDVQKLEEVLRRVEANDLTEEDCQTIRTLLASYVHLTELLRDKSTSLARLRRMLFGASTEKTAAVLGGGKDSQSPSAGPAEAAAKGNLESDSASATERGAKMPPPGHGRNGAEAYAGAEKVVVKHESLQAGDPCPQCDKGTIYETGRPGVLVRLVGQAPIQAKIYELQKLRCNLCGVVFTAQPPTAVGRRSMTLRWAA